MKPIYKSLTLAAMALQVSLALNAETRDDESASTMALQAELLDSLRVELVAQNVSGARNLIESGECVIDGSNLTITLDTSEWIRGAMYRIQVLATFGTQTQVIYALSVTVPYYIAFSNTPQEYEDAVTVASTITDVTEADLEGLALEVTSQEIKTTVNGQAQDLEALAQNYGRLAADLQAIKDAHVLGFSYDGLIFVEGYEPRSAFGIIAERQHILEIHDDYDLIIPAMEKNDYPSLEVMEMKSAVSATDILFLSGSSSIRSIIIPKLGVGNHPMMIVKGFENMTNLVHLDLTYTDIYTPPYGSNQSFSGDINLIDLICGREFTGSKSIHRWNPTNAILDNSISLLTQEDIDAGFTSNREKLLYNIREHIAANLPDRTDDTPFTITFSPTLRDAFDQATEDAFAAKNWDIAPARS